MKTFSIIGAGRLGTCLGAALAKAGYKISHITCRTIIEARESHWIIGQGEAGTDNIVAAKSAEVIILTVPDNVIEKTAKQLADKEIEWDKKCVYHCGGLYPSSILNPLKTLGAATASIHPVQSFPKKYGDPRSFKNIYFSLEGDDQAIRIASVFIQKLGSHSFIISADDKPLYHTACSVASNFLVTLLDAAIFLLTQTGLEEEKASEIIFPLVQGTLHNVKDFSIPSSLTGPIIRGDTKTIKKHVQSLHRYPDIHSIYRELAIRALKIARKEQDINPSAIKNVKKLLADK